MSYKLDPDQAQHFVGPDLGPICLQRLWQMKLGRQRVKSDKLLMYLLMTKNKLS